MWTKAAVVFSGLVLAMNNLYKLIFGTITRGFQRVCSSNVFQHTSSVKKNQKKTKAKTKTLRQRRCRTTHRGHPDVFSLGFRHVGFHLVYFRCRACSESLWCHIWTLMVSVSCCWWATSKNTNKLQRGTIKCLNPSEMFIGSDLQLSHSSSEMSDSC